MKILLIQLMFLLNLNALSPAVDYCFENNKEGLNKKYYDNGQLWKLINYKKYKKWDSMQSIEDGYYDGEYKEYYIDGNLKVKAFYQKNKSIKQTFYKTGKLKSAIKVDDIANRKITTEYFENGFIPRKLETSTKWDRNATTIEYYENSSIKSKTIKNRYDISFKKEYYKNLKLKYLYNNNIVKSYYENSNLKYFHDKNNSIEKQYYINGKLEYIIDNDKKETYYENGNILSRYHIIDQNTTIPGKKTLVEFYHSNGQLERKYTYFNTKELNGIFEIVKTYYDTGELKSEISYNGGKSGLSKEYYKNNKIKSKINYKNNTLHGSYTTYFDDGKIKTQKNYKYLSYKNSRLDGIKKERYTKSHELRIEKEYTKLLDERYSDKEKYFSSDKLYDDAPLISHELFDIDHYEKNKDKSMDTHEIKDGLEVGVYYNNHTYSVVTKYPKPNPFTQTKTYNKDGNIKSISINKELDNAPSWYNYSKFFIYKAEYKLGKRVSYQKNEKLKMKFTLEQLVSTINKYYKNIDLGHSSTVLEFKKLSYDDIEEIKHNSYVVKDYGLLKKGDKNIDVYFIESVLMHDDIIVEDDNGQHSIYNMYIDANTGEILLENKLVPKGSACTNGYEEIISKENKGNNFRKIDKIVIEIYPQKGPHYYDSNNHHDVSIFNIKDRIDE